jgi:hypothetical protein
MGFINLLCIVRVRRSVIAVITRLFHLLALSGEAVKQFAHLHALVYAVVQNECQKRNPPQFNPVAKASTEKTGRVDKPSHCGSLLGLVAKNGDKCLGLHQIRGYLKAGDRGELNPGIPEFFRNDDAQFLPNKFGYSLGSSAHCSKTSLQKLYFISHEFDPLIHTDQLQNPGKFLLDNFALISDTAHGQNSRLPNVVCAYLGNGHIELPAKAILHAPHGPPPIF